MLWVAEVRKVDQYNMMLNMFLEIMPKKGLEIN